MAEQQRKTSVSCHVMSSRRRRFATVGCMDESVTSNKISVICQNFWRLSKFACSRLSPDRLVHWQWQMLSGTRYLTNLKTWRVVLTVLNSSLRQSCSVSTNVTSALEVFLKWYALYKFTFYLLTYLLNQHIRCLPRFLSPSTRPTITLPSTLSCGCLITCPKYRSFRDLMWFSRSLSVPAIL